MNSDTAEKRRRAEDLKRLRPALNLHKKTDEELIAKANDMLFHLDSAVRAFDAAVRAANEMKDNDALRKMRKDKEIEDGELDRALDDLLEAKQREHFYKDQESAKEKRIMHQYLSEVWKQEVKEKMRLKAVEERITLEQERETLRLCEEAEKQQKKTEEEKMKSYDRMTKDFIEDKSIEKALEQQRQEIERKRVDETRKELEKHWDNLEKEKQKRTAEKVRKLVDTSMKVAVILQKEVEDLNVKRAEEVERAEESAKQKLQKDLQRYDREKQQRDARIRSITAYRKSVEKAKAETLNAAEQESKASRMENMNAHKLYLEKEQQKKVMQKDMAQFCHEFNRKVMADKSATEEEVTQKEKEKLELDKDFWSNYDNRFHEYVAEKFRIAEEKQVDTTPMRLFLKKHKTWGTELGHGLWHGNANKEVNNKIPDYIREQRRNDLEGPGNVPKRSVTWRSPEVSSYVASPPNSEDAGLPSQDPASTPAPADSASFTSRVCSRKDLSKIIGSKVCKGQNSTRRTPTFILPNITAAASHNLSLPRWHP